MTPTRPLVEVPQQTVEELRRRLAQTRWPTPWPVADWKAGTSEAELRRLVEYWRSGYDWRVHEAELNELPSHLVVIDGRPLHYLRFEGERPRSVPIVLTNGWPSTFFELPNSRNGWPCRRGSGSTPRSVSPSSCRRYRLYLLRAASFPPERPAHPRVMAPAHARPPCFASYAAHGGDLGAGITSRPGGRLPRRGDRHPPDGGRRARDTSTRQP
jgi:hypothetical protein